MGLSTGDVQSHFRVILDNLKTTSLIRMQLVRSILIAAQALFFASDRVEKKMRTPAK